MFVCSVENLCCIQGFATKGKIFFVKISRCYKWQTFINAQRQDRCRIVCFVCFKHSRTLTLSLSQKVIRHVDTCMHYNEKSSLAYIQKCFNIRYIQSSDRNRLLANQDCLISGRTKCFVSIVRLFSRNLLRRT